MRRVLVGLIFSATMANAQATARFVPLSLLSTSAQTGPPQEAGVWHVEVCSRGSEPIQAPLPRVMELAPQVRYLPAEFAVSLIDSRTRRQPARVATRIATAAAGVATTLGVVRDSVPMAAAGAAVSALLPLIQREERAPFSLPEPCPRVVAVAPGGCFECNVMAAKISGAATIGPLPIR